MIREEQNCFFFNEITERVWFSISDRWKIDEYSDFEGFKT